MPAMEDGGQSVKMRSGGSRGDSKREAALDVKIFNQISQKEGRIPSWRLCPRGSVAATAVANNNEESREALQQM